MVWNLAHGQHAGEQLGDLDGSRTHEARTALDTHLLHLLDDGCIFLALRLIDAVVEVLADHRTVGRNLHDIELVDVPELTRLRRSRTRHTGELVVHTEVVLQRDGSEGLCGSLHLHVLLGLDSLVQAIAPAAAFHDTTRLLIDDLYLAVHDDILIVLVEHRVRLEQLLQGVHAVALNGVVVEEVILLVETLLVAQSLLVLESGELRGDVGEHEEVLVVHLVGEPFGTFIREVGGVHLLVDNEIQRLDSLRHAAVVVLHVDLLGLLHATLDTLLREVFDERLVLRQRLEGTVEAEETLVEELLCFVLVGLLTAGVDLLAGVGEELCSLLALHLIELLYERLVLLVHLVLTLGHGTGNDERGTGIIDQHGVDLIDDGEIVTALHEVVGRECHVVTQIVEAELIVRTEGDIRLVSLAALGGVGLVFVDTVDGESVELIERSHPLRVTLGEVVVDRHHVHAVACEGVEEHGERSHEGLTLTGSHLSDLALVEGDATEELHVVVHHVPVDLVAAGCPLVVVDSLVTVDGDEVVLRIGSELAVEIGRCHHGVSVLRKAAGGVLDDGESHGHDLVEGFLQLIEHLLVLLVYLVEDRLTLIDRRVLNLGTELGNLFLVRLGSVLHVILYLLALGTELVVGQFLNVRVGLFHFLYEWLNEAHVALRLIPEDGSQKLVEVHILLLFFLIWMQS